MDRSRIVAHVAAACGSKAGVGAYAVLLTFGYHEKEFAGTVDKITGNAASILAVIQAIRAVKRSMTIEVRTRSHYFMKSLPALDRWEADNWIRRDPGTDEVRDVANSPLWKTLIAEIRRGGHKMRYVHVVDDLADVYDQRVEKSARDELVRARESVAEPDLFSPGPRR